MKCLTEAECSEWLKGRGIVESPYAASSRTHDFCFQFEPPHQPFRITALVRSLFELFEPFPSGLIVFNDLAFAFDYADEKALFESIRRGHGENRSMIEVPGHLFEATEPAEAIGHCYLALMFGWSAYLYLSSGTVTLLFWEGDLVDVWSHSAALDKSIREVVQNLELRIL